METQIKTANSGVRKMGVAPKIETAANIIVVAVLIAMVLFKSYVMPMTTHQVAAGSAPIFLGSSMDGRAIGVDWKANRHTLVLALLTICHY